MTSAQTEASDEDRLREIVDELLSWEWFWFELDVLLGGDEGV